ncbi:class I SAM-dependent methyltransferase [Nonomuraea sp. NPDC059023]|uniref:class I SAM-dependent methyltransferase n=1 Tax=unclassified Nonomuraea TaxID=2593643 RepID=UPI00369B850B
MGRFERWAAGYDDSLPAAVSEPVQAALLDLLDNHRPPPGVLVDVGCATGRLLRRARERYPDARLIGVDAAHAMLAAARPCPSGSGLVRARAERLPLADAGADVVTATLSCRHWHDLAAGLREIARVLAPGGVFAYADLTHPPPRRLGARPRPDGLSRHLAAAGLAIQAQRVISGTVLFPWFRLVIAGR